MIRAYVSLFGVALALGCAADLGPSRCDGETSFFVWETATRDGVISCTESHNASFSTPAGSGFPRTVYGVGIDIAGEPDRLCSLTLDVLNIPLIAGETWALVRNVIPPRDEHTQAAWLRARVSALGNDCAPPATADRSAVLRITAGELHVVTGGTFGDVVELELRDVVIEVDDGLVIDLPYTFFRVRLGEG